jgi:hypothetical protein
MPPSRERYPGFHVMDERRHWDPVTRSMLEERVNRPPVFRFFDAGEQRTLGALLAVVLALDPAEPAGRIPVLEMVDAKFHEGKLDGYRYDDMPRDDETWRRVAAHLDGFAGASAEERRSIVERFASGELEWDDLNVTRAWGVVMRGALAAFYSHPWAWDEIGFRGPAYPRGYMRRNMGPSGTDPDEPAEAYDFDPVGYESPRGRR